MLRFPNCKINIGLTVLDKREDGFHNIESLFYPIAINDCLEIVVNNNAVEPLIFSQSGLSMDANIQDNICVKAYYLIKKDFPKIDSLQTHLHKQIPMGAGLGGGSADGVVVLQMLNDLFTLNLSSNQLSNYALQLGSDCPFFIHNKPCIATGRGEVLKEISLNLAGYHLVIVNPSIHINTAWAFAQLNISRKIIESQNLLHLISQPIETWKNTIKNDFEEPVFSTYPAIQKIKETLYNFGACYASMSGSGSTVYGIFNGGALKNINFEANYYVKIISL